RCRTRPRLTKPSLPSTARSLEAGSSTLAKPGQERETIPNAAVVSIGPQTVWINGEHFPGDNATVSQRRNTDRPERLNAMTNYSKQYVRTLLELCDKSLTKEHRVYEMLVKQGKVFDNPVEAPVELMDTGNCFDNAYEYAVKYKLKYCEGY